MTTDTDTDNTVNCVGDLTIRHLGTDILVRPEGEAPYTGTLRALRLTEQGRLILTCGQMNFATLDTRCEVLS